MPKEYRSQIRYFDSKREALEASYKMDGTAIENEQ